MGGRGRALIAAWVLTALVAGCGDDDGKRYSDDKIVEAVHLEESLDGDAYAIDGDPFCEVDKKLLNDADEVEDAAGDDTLVVASREGNVGVVGTGAFAHNCQVTARKRLNKLDPRPKGE
jgi:hypothetical protein